MVYPEVKPQKKGRARGLCGRGGGGCSDEGMGESKASILGLGSGGVNSGAGEVTKRVPGGNACVGWGDGKIIQPVGLGDVPSDVRCRRTHRIGVSTSRLLSCVGAREGGGGHVVGGMLLKLLWYIVRQWLWCDVAWCLETW